MKRIKRFKTLTAVLAVLFYFCSLAPSLLAAPRTPAPGPGAVVPPPTSPPAAPPACPLVRAISPSSLRQGQSATLILNGQDLNQIVSITMGTGITVMSLNNSNSSSAQVTVQVAVNAPLGNHALLMTTASGPATIGAVTGCGTVEARPRLQITARSTELVPGQIVPPTQPGRIPGLATPQPSQADKKLLATEIYPNQWSRGKNYTVNLVGLGFTADMLVQLGDGIQVKGKVKLLNPNLAQIQVEISGSAVPGERKVQLRLNSQDPWTPTQATAYVKTQANQGLSLLQLPETDFKNFLKGKIKLLQPYSEGTNAEKFINDMTQFWWEEENPGTADWYELRFLDNNGQVLVKRRIDPSGPGQKPPQFYKPDQAFFDEMCNHKPYGLCGYYLKQTSGTAAMLLSLNWEVAGFKTYTYTKITKKPGVTPGSEQVVKSVETKEIEVEISERWKIDGPIQPSGLVCSDNEAKKGLDADSQLQIVNLDLGKGRPAGTLNTVNFVNDQFKLIGQLRFWNPPYNYQAGSVAGNPYTQFNNIFVDWGDGTTTPLKGTPYADSWGDQRLQIPEGMYQHRYTRTGAMIFRIFMLPFEDIQGTDPALVTANYDNQQNNGNDPYFVVLKAGLQGVWPDGQSGGQSGPSLNDLAKRAHVLYCKEIVIDPRQDPVSNGTLHLVSVKITGANGRGFNEPVEAVGPPAQVKAPATLTVPKPLTPSSPSSGGPVTLKPNVQVQAGAVQPGSPVNTQNLSTAKVNPAMFYEASDLSLSQCDRLQLNATLTYYGKGEAWVTWRMNTNLSQGGINDAGGIVVASQYPVLIGPSKSRDMSKLSPEQAGEATTASYDTYPLDAPIQKMDGFPIGKAFSLKPEVTVGPETVKSLTLEAVLNALSALFANRQSAPQSTDLAHRSATVYEETMIDAAGESFWEPGRLYAVQLSKKPLLLALAGTKTAASKTSASQAASSAMASAIRKSGAKLGVLSPFKEGGAMPSVANISGALDTSTAPQYDTTFPKTPPFHVGAKPLSYKAVANSADKPCKFLFTTKSNDVFEIFNLDDVKADAQGRYWGHGTLEIQLFSGSYFQCYKRLLPIKISGWQLSGDNLNAAPGTQIKEALGDQVPPASGMEIIMEKIEAKAYQTDLSLTLSIAPQDKRLRVPGSSEPVSWKNRTARLTAFGDWFYQDPNEKEISIGWSGFRLQKVKAALDLSSQENHAQGGTVQADGFTTSSGNEWTGIHLGQAVLIPNTATLSGSNVYEKTVANWGIIEGGLCGNADLGVFSTIRKGGTIGWDSLHANAEQGNFNATYNNIKIQLPWPYVELKGNAVLADGTPGQDSFIDFRNIKADKVTRNYGTIIMESSDFVFGMFSDYPGVDWAVKANTRFSFRQEGQVYSTDTVVQDVVFGMDAIAYYKGNVQIPLNGKANFGAVPLDMISMEVGGFGTQALKFDLKTKFSVSEVLEAVDVPLTYTLAKPGSAFIDDYQAINPVLQPFKLQVAYPSFQPKVTSQLTLKHKGSQGTAGLSPEGARYAALDRKLIRPTTTDAGAPLDEELLLAAADGAGTEDAFNTEKIDMQLLGENMPSVEFRIGYKEGHDYWLMRVKVNVADMPLAPPFLFAYQIRGGLGHNFPIETFSAPGSIYAVEPVINGSYLFNAGLLAGSADKVLYAFDGDFTISTEEGALFKFKAWIMKYDHSGEGDFGGYLAYGGGSFDGSLSGEFGYIGDQVRITVPEGAATLHFGDDGWHIYLGKDTGPRLEGHAFFIDANAYLMLDSTPRLRVGAGAKKHFAAGNCSKVCAYIDVHFDAGFDMSLDPMYIAGEAEMGASAGLCVWKFGCVDIGITFHAWASVPPPYLYIEFSTSATPCPVDSIGIGVKILPSPGIGWSIDWCDCLIFDC